MVHNKRSALAAAQWGLTALAAVCAPALGQAITFSLPAATSQVNRFNIQLELNDSPLLRDSDASDASGTIDIDLQWDLAGADIVLTALEITGAALDFTDLNFSLGFGAVAIKGTNMGGTMDTPSPPSAIAEGKFNAADHTLTINRGVFTVSGLFSDTFDLAASPFSGPGLGEGQITLTELGRTPQEIQYEATVTVPVIFSDRVLDAAAGDPATLDLDVNGTLVAIGQFAAPLAPPAENADFNGDGVVDGLDLSSWQRGTGLTAGASLTQGDANGDGAVDDLDFGIWERQFAGSPPAAAQAIPEPVAGALALWASAGVGACRPRRRQ
jgi:hypothetical protein